MQRPSTPRTTLREILLAVLSELDSERLRVSHVLHDEVGQVLSAVGLHLDVLRLDLKKRVPDIAARTAGIQQILEGAVQQVRRLSYELSPVPVERAGLSAALKGLAARLRESCPGELRAECPDRLALPPPAALAMYRIAEMALDNAIRHSGARRIQLLVAERGGVRLEVRDNGRGFDLARERRRPSGLGLLRMEACARRGGLKLTLASAPGRDTIVKTVYKAQAEAAGKRTGNHRSGRAETGERPFDNGV